MEGSLDPAKVKGRLVYCKLAEAGSESVVKGIGGVGAIIESDQFLDFDVAKIFMAPGTIVNGTIGEFINEYTKSTK